MSVSLAILAAETGAVPRGRLEGVNRLARGQAVGDAETPSSAPREGFRHALDRQGPRLCRLAFFLCGDPREAEAVVAEAFARAWPKWRSRQLADAPQWLRRRVVRLAIARRRWRHGGGEEAPAAGEGGELIVQLMHLPGNQRAVIVLRYLEGLDDQEIATSIGTSLDRVPALEAAAAGALEPLLDPDVDRDPTDEVLVGGESPQQPTSNPIVPSPRTRATLRAAFDRAGSHSPGMVPSRRSVAVHVTRRRHRRVAWALGTIAAVTLAVLVPLAVGGSAPRGRSGVVQLGGSGSSTGAAASGSSGSTTVAAGASGGSTPSSAAVELQTLAPASEPPVQSECSVTVDVAPNGDISPLFCADGGINVLAWQAYAKRNPSVMSLGRGATSSDVLAAMCNDLVSSVHASVDDEKNIEALAARYNGWTFTISGFSAASCRSPGK